MPIHIAATETGFRACSSGLRRAWDGVPRIVTPGDQMHNPENIPLSNPFDPCVFLGSILKFKVQREKWMHVATNARLTV